MKKFFTVFLLSLLGLFAVAVRNLSVAYATGTTIATVASAASGTLQQQLDVNNQEITNLNQEIATYQAELQQVGADKKTLQSAINALDLQRKKVEAQVSVTKYQINATQLQITQLGGEISDAKQTITTDQASLGEYFRIMQTAEHQPLIMQLLSSGDIAEAWSDANATQEIQDAVQKEMQALKAHENDLADSQIATKQKQQTLASQQQSLASQQISLAATVRSKSELLTATKAEESNYEKLLAAAEAELNSFSAFAQNAGGSKLLVNQTVCDSWGCYYNQRDALWGNNPLDGTRYKLASDGCLVTAVAMVMTHYGYRDVTPATINSNPDNFASYYPAYLLTSINVDGVTATRKVAAIDATLATGNPVIVGLYAYGGTHFVVLVSGKRGNYVMRDPYVANGKDISFSAHYSLRRIFAVTKVVIGS
ncbi:MAG TPA: C39 family peptidase [Candidatus Paceibacterota bacterium]|nr:C39 family peptidase [Candidatus Paceibacterota bacterium]